MAHPKSYDGGITNFGYHRPKMIQHTVNSGEESSGIALITYLENPTDTDDVGFTTQVVDSTNKVKTDGMKVDYNTSSGVIVVENADTNLAENDIVTVIGMKFV